MSSSRGLRRQKRQAPVDPPADPRFRDEDSEAALASFSRIRLIVSKSVSPLINYGFGLFALFVGTGLEFPLSQNFQFSSTFVYLWCANLRPCRAEVARSFYAGQVVDISAEDLAHYAEIPNDGEQLWPLFRNDATFRWREVNTLLTGSPGNGLHNPEVKYLCRDAYVIQHVLRNNILYKAGDKVHITPVLSLATYFCMRRIRFNVAEVFLEMIRGISSLSMQRRPHNISLGHLIQHVITQKYSVPLGPGITNDLEVVPFRLRDIVHVLRRFDAGEEDVADEGGYDDEADAAGIGGEHREAMEEAPVPPRRSSVSEYLERIETGMGRLHTSGAARDVVLARIEADMGRLHTSGEARDVVLARMLAEQQGQGTRIDTMEQHVSDFYRNWDSLDPSRGGGAGDEDDAPPGTYF